MTMRLIWFVPFGSAIAFLAIATATGASADPVTVYTGDDLERMFGPAPAQSSEPVDKTRPEDWRFVERFLDRQYSRIDADRTYELKDRAIEVATMPAVPAWDLRYPASVWWQAVHGTYARSTGRHHDDEQRHRHK